jgi:predicted house-cleaning noncanonical NTP pyrophosphatase (MazG superfamily)
MPGMLNLADVLELVIHRFNQRPFAKENLIDQLEQAIFHGLLRLRHQL